MKEQKRTELYAKQGRGSQFTSRAERDKWIAKELKSLQKAIKDKKEQIAKLKEDLKEDDKKKTEFTVKIEENTAQLDAQRQNIDEQNVDFYEMKKQKEALQNNRNEQWRKENTLQQSLATLKEELAKKDQAMRSMIGKATLNGRDSVGKVLKTFRDRAGEYSQIAEQYYGMLIQNFTCERSLYTAVEVTSGAKLFYHIVQSDSIGTKILNEMNRQKLPGEVTFMPFNRLMFKDINYPQNDNAIAMISKLKFQPKFEQVMKYIYGKTLICRNLEVATQIARTSNLDCITLEGDQVSHKGALTGGYLDPRRSRLDLHHAHAQLSSEVMNEEDQLEKHRATLAETEAKINRLVSDMQKAETKNSKNKDVFERSKTDIRLMKEEINVLDRARPPKERSLLSLESSLKSMESTETSLKSEKEQDLLKQLSVADQQEVDRLNDEIRRLTQSNKDAFSKRMSLEGQKNKLENSLNNNLYRRKEELEAALQEISVEDRKQKLANSGNELTILNDRIKKVKEAMDAVEVKMTSKNKDLKDVSKKLEAEKTKERDYQERINEDSKDLEKISSKQALLQKKLEECAKKIRDLGTIPAECGNYKKHSTKQLFKMLEQCNQELKRYSHVNKKALDQFVSFSEQKEKLISRKQELDRGYESIMDLMRALEHRKYEAIQLTFKQVSKYFSEVFTKLVPQGNASLVMKSDKEDQTVESMEDSASTSDAPVMEQFEGVGIRVSFSGRQAEMKEMQQLSGGQKSLVALALIFAIQKCDPAPFYLFDEIDQALDSQHRKAVADMIHELAQEAQFITTTFRPELLEHADKFYGVKFRNKVSHIEAVSQDDAREFVEDDAMHA